MRLKSVFSRWTSMAAAMIAAAGLLAPASLAQGRSPSLAGMEGGELTEANLLSGNAIVVIWASWSPRGRDIVQRVNAIEKQWGSGTRVVTVNYQEERAAIESFLAGKNLAAPVYLDVRGAFSKKNAVTTLPGVLIYKDGELAYRGKLPADANALIERILG